MLSLARKRMSSFLAFLRARALADSGLLVDSGMILALNWRRIFKVLSVEPPSAMISLIFE